MSPASGSNVQQPCSDLQSDGVEGVQSAAHLASPRRCIQGHVPKPVGPGAASHGIVGVGGFGTGVRAVASRAGDIDLERDQQPAAAPLDANCADFRRWSSRPGVKWAYCPNGRNRGCRGFGSSFPVENDSASDQKWHQNCKRPMFCDSWLPRHGRGRRFEPCTAHHFYYRNLRIVGVFADSRFP